MNSRQTGAMTLQVRTRNGNVSDINMDSEKVEGLCFPLLFPHTKHGYTNVSKSHLSPDEYVMARLSGCILVGSWISVPLYCAVITRALTCGMRLHRKLIHHKDIC